MLENGWTDELIFMKAHIHCMLSFHILFSWTMNIYYVFELKMKDTHQFAIWNCLFRIMLGSLKSWYRDFRSNTSIHGLSYTLDNVRVVALMWYGAVGVGFYLIGLYCGNLIQDWQENPVSYSFGSLSKPITELQVVKIKHNRILTPYVQQNEWNPAYFQIILNINVVVLEICIFSQFPTIVVCPGKNMVSGVTMGWAFVEHILNWLDPADAINRDMFEFIPNAIVKHRTKANQYFIDFMWAGNLK